LQQNSTAAVPVAVQLVQWRKQGQQDFTSNNLLSVDPCQDHHPTRKKLLCLVCHMLRWRNCLCGTIIAAAAAAAAVLQARLALRASSLATSHTPT
jgi:hypothetical protein